MELNGKAALVLGGIKGIGKAVALGLAESGASVAATYFDWEEELPALERDLSRAARDHLVLRADLEQETTLRAKRWVFAACLPHLKASGAGAVVNVSSIAGLVGRAGPAAPVFNDGYAAACRAVSSFTESWAREGAPEVRVNEIMLGFVATRHGPGTRGWGLLNDAERQAIHDHTLLGRTGTLDDVVKAVMFVLRDAPFMTGSVLRLDGGYVLGGETVPPMPQGVG
jgi:3-oxoacyl-[acyl-carrier protein] reductase